VLSALRLNDDKANRLCLLLAGDVVALGAGRSRPSRALAQFAQAHDRVLINGVQRMGSGRFGSAFSFLSR
jgi:hypothetical protein